MENSEPRVLRIRRWCRQPSQSPAGGRGTGRVYARGAARIAARPPARPRAGGYSLPHAMSEPSRAERERPLAGVRVLDLSRVLAGPYCTMLLADLGADVIKVERPGQGDETRGWGPPFVGGEAAYYLSVNRGKRSVAIDFATEEGRAALLDLAATADVVVENFRAGVLDRLGIGFEAIAERRPGIVFCTITGFGSGREPAGRPGYDFIVQAESGFMSITGDERPTKAGVAVVDVLAGLHLGMALLAGLRRAEATGRAERIEVSLLDAGLAGLVNQAANAIATGSEPRRYGNAHPNIVPYQVFRTADGEIAVAVGNDSTFEQLCRAMGLAGLAAEERFATNAARVEHREELVEILSARFAEEPAERWLERLDAAGVPAGKIRGPLEAIEAAAAAGEEATITLAGGLRLVGSPWRFDGEPMNASSPPPKLGEHTDELLGGGGGPPRPQR